MSTLNIMPNYTTSYRSLSRKFYTITENKIAGDVIYTVLQYRLNIKYYDWYGQPQHAQQDIFFLFYFHPTGCYKLVFVILVCLPSHYIQMMGDFLAFMVNKNRCKYYENPIMVNIVCFEHVIGS